jgi:hypothetical protein
MSHNTLDSVSTTRKYVLSEIANCQEFLSKEFIPYSDDLLSRLSIPELNRVLRTLRVLVDTFSERLKVTSQCG